MCAPSLSFRGVPAVPKKISQTQHLFQSSCCLSSLCLLALSCPNKKDEKKKNLQAVLRKKKKEVEYCQRSHEAVRAATLCDDFFETLL